jgi:hypothetical protein
MLESSSMSMSSPDAIDIAGHEGPRQGSAVCEGLADRVSSELLSDLSFRLETPSVAWSAYQVPSLSIGEGVAVRKTDGSR